MIKNTLISISLLLFTVSATASEPDKNLNKKLNKERKKELLHLLKQDCGSCHGMTLKGGLGPALLPENLVGKPDYVLVNTIKYGREILAMPAWDNLLTTTEIEWLVAQLKKGIE